MIEIRKRKEMICYDDDDHKLVYVIKLNMIE